MNKQFTIKFKISHLSPANKKHNDLNIKNKSSKYYNYLSEKIKFK